ncbi:MAG TPA: hypothetical protein VHD76_07095 [Bryobacteraceae bacterium]|nr:hypothetical protein [Bryobacteraceae bacterium]
MRDVRELAGVVRDFLAGCRDPVLEEPGEELYSLARDCHSLEESGGRLALRVWDERRTLTRRILRVAGRSRARLDLRVEHFGKREGALTLLDRAAVSNYACAGRCARQSFSERFRRMLFRQFPGAPVTRLSSEPDLAHSLSPVFPRALLESAGSALAAIAAPPGSAHPEGILTFGLIWLDYLRRRGLKIRTLALFVPEGREGALRLRAIQLNSNAVTCRIFAYSGSGEQSLDFCDSGNVDTRLERERIFPELPQATPEKRMEAGILNAIETLDARLRPDPVYCQAATFAAGQRGIMDILAVDRSGRLTIVELKASEDIHLPLQALDYWIRVKWHLDRGELQARGYFPRVELRREPPRLILAAPALQFHPANETILRFFHPTIEVVRVGLSPDLRVMFRM